MTVLRDIKGVISLRSLERHRAHLRELTQLCAKYLFSPSEAHLPFLRFRLHYIMFLLFFVVYSVSPLKMCSDRTLRGLLQDSEAASIRIVIVERVLALMLDGLTSAEGLVSSDDADIEVMVKKKRALLRSFTLLFLLLMAIAAHVAARLNLFSALALGRSCFPFSRSSEHIKISDAYHSPHSGLSPPYLLA